MKWTHTSHTVPRLGYEMGATLKANPSLRTEFGAGTLSVLSHLSPPDLVHHWALTNQMAFGSNSNIALHSTLPWMG